MLANVSLERKVNQGNLTLTNHSLAALVSPPTN